jgi:hypothetical protein
MTRSACRREIDDATLRACDQCSLPLLAEVRSRSAAPAWLSGAGTLTAASARDAACDRQLGPAGSPSERQRLITARARCLAGRLPDNCYGPGCKSFNDNPRHSGGNTNNENIWSILGSGMCHRKHINYRIGILARTVADEDAELVARSQMTIQCHRRSCGDPNNRQIATSPFNSRSQFLCLLSSSSPCRGHSRFSRACQVAPQLHAHFSSGASSAWPGWLSTLGVKECPLFGLNTLLLRHHRAAVGR